MVHCQRQKIVFMLPCSKAYSDVLATGIGLCGTWGCHSFTYILVTGTDEVEPTSDTHFWFTLFQHAFLISESHDACATGPRDDLLFFVGKKTTVSSKVRYATVRLF
ncbi:hypothetical protein AHF37_04851 [Paragonimus kellicotti]|nr:hypothetical protein AHF37_04851 [Paragonimus kellicotti]